MKDKDKNNKITGDARTEDRPTGIPWRIAAWVVAALFLTTIFVGGQVSAEINWTVSDFVVAGLLLFGTLGVYEVAVWTTRDIVYRTSVGVALVGTLLLTWINLAVGITDGAADLAYLGVPVVGGIGALIARFRAEGMAKALFAMAVVQALIAVIALAAGMVPTYNTTFEIVGINAIFIVLFVGAGWLFREAARRELERGTA